MAQQTLVTLIDDLDGSEAQETVSFGLDGVDYSIDLSTPNADRLRARLAEFVAHARKSAGRKRQAATRGATRLKTTIASGGNREQNQAIRDWARAQGHQLSDRGRIPSSLIEDFHAAH